MYTVTILKADQPIYSQQVDNLVLLDVIQAINSAPPDKVRKSRKDKGVTKAKSKDTSPECTTNSKT